MPKLSTIYDAFDGDGPNTGLWNDSAGVTQVSGDGYATVPPSGTYSNFLGFTPPSRDFTEDAFQWEWTFPSAGASGSEQYCSIGDGTTGEKVDYGRWSGGLGYFLGATSEFAGFDDTSCRFMRIRTTSSQMFFETSPDGVTWVNPFTTGVQALPAWDLSSVQVHFINGFFSGSGGGDMRVQSVGVASTTISGSLAGQYGGIATDLEASLSSPGQVAGDLGPARLAAAGRLVSRTTLAGVFGGISFDAAGSFESSAEDVTVSAGPPRVASLGAGAPVLSPGAAGPVVERNA